MGLSVSDAFDGGNVIARAVGDGEVRVAIRTDGAAAFLQWFFFRIDGERETSCRIVVENASETSYPKGWEGYGVATSTDLSRWYRTPTEYDGQSLSWQVEPGSSAVWFAYFAPYTLARHEAFVARISAARGVVLESLGPTPDGRSIDCLHVRGASRSGPDGGSVDGVAAGGSGQSFSGAVAEASGDSDPERRQLWVIARQHPGESMAEWWIEGWLERLLDEDDATGRALRSIADIHVVPNMNPDGTFRGHLRTNACGANLNREWSEPSPERSPEVHQVRRRMHETGVDFALDIHGDEVLPYNFIAGPEGVPSWSAERDAELVAFRHTLAALNPDFQTVHGYPRTPPGKANLTYASNYIAETFGCPAMTLEMPFKDTADTPRPDVGWSPERCRRLGRSFVDAVYLALTDRLLRPSA